MLVMAEAEDSTDALFCPRKTRRKRVRERKGGDAATPASAVAERLPRQCPEPGNSEFLSAETNNLYVAKTNHQLNSHHGCSSARPKGRYALQQGYLRLNPSDSMFIFYRLETTFHCCCCCQSVFTVRARYPLRLPNGQGVAQGRKR